MPLIEIQMLPGPNRKALERVAQRVNAEVAAVLGARIDAVWTTWRTVDGYAVGPSLAEHQPADSHAPIVHVYARRTPEEAERICDVIGAVFGEELGLGAVRHSPAGLLPHMTTARLLRIWCVAGHSESGRSWIRTTDLRLIRAAL